MYGFNYSCWGTGKWSAEARQFITEKLSTFGTEIKKLWDFLFPHIAFDVDAMDKKHGFYYLRIGTDSNDHDLSLKVKMSLKGNQM